MRVTVAFGLDQVDLDLPAGVAAPGAQPPAVADPIAAVRAALETPHRWPALRQAVTPDDHIAVVVDEQLPHLGTLLVPLLEHLQQAQIMPAAVTLVCAPSAGTQDWIEELPDAFADVQVEVHDPRDRRKLAYLATTRQGRRLYLNRTVVDADQVVVFGARRYDPVLGYAGGESALYPILSDEATRADLFTKASLAVPSAAWPARQEAVETAWLLGAPFLVQFIPGAGDALAHVVGGSLDASEEGRRLLDARWKQTVARPADLVIATVSGDPARHDFATLAQALANAARVVQPGGRIVLLTQAAPALGEAGELLRRSDAPREVLDALKREKHVGLTPALHWATAADKASIFLLSGLEEETAEELFTTPMQQASQAARLAQPHETTLLLPDAHRALAVGGAG